MDILDKIRDEIAEHEREIERLTIALDVMERLAKKGVLKPTSSKPAPMFTVKRVGGKKAAPAKPSGMPMTDRIIAAVEANGPLTSKQMKTLIDFSGRKPNSLYTSLGDLLKQNKLIRDGKVYRLASRKETTPEAPVETEAESSEGGHAAAA
jgi:hypothetical protein